MKSAPGPLEDGELLERHRGPVDPARRRGRLDHRELATHVVGGQRHRDLVAHRGQHVERRHGGLDHDHVRALGHVLRDFGQRLAAVARVLLVGPAVTAAGDGDVDRVAERAVERGGVLGGVGQDGDPVVAPAVERGADGRHLPVHHAAGRHHVRPGLGLGQGDALVELERRVVEHLARRDRGCRSARGRCTRRGRGRP